MCGPCFYKPNPRTPCLYMSMYPFSNQSIIPAIFLLSWYQETGFLTRLRFCCPRCATLGYAPLADRCEDSTPP